MLVGTYGGTSRSKKVAASGGGGLSPTTGSALWLDAAAAYVTKDGGTGAVSVWADRSGNSVDLSQGTGSLQPIWTDAQLNSLPVIVFDGSDDYLISSAAAIPIASPYTVYLVAKYTTWVEVRHFFSGDTAFVGLACGARPGEIELYVGGHTNTYIAFAAATYGIISCGYNGASSYIQINNGAADTGTVPANAFGSTLNLGRYAAGGYCLNCAIAEMLVYSGAHADGGAEQTETLAYLNDKYAIY